MSADNVIKIRRNEDFAVIDCYKCGREFAVPESVDRHWRNSGNAFFCPQGHSQHYQDAPEIQYRNELNDLKGQISELKSDNAKLKLKVRPPLLSRLWALTHKENRDV